MVGLLKTKEHKRKEAQRKLKEKKVADEVLYTAKVEARKRRHWGSNEPVMQMFHAMVNGSEVLMPRGDALGQ